jgi:hypothetical protein
MNIHQATARYESWLKNQIHLLPADLRIKHALMREHPFLFLRATFYRWAQVWPDAAVWGAGPVVLSVGDLHAENFGTWRDVEGRLVWGVNDYDEAHPLPYTNDLTRLATSAFLAAGQLDIPPKRATAEILRGYEKCLNAGGRPFVLVDRSTPLRELVRHRLKKPQRFWKKLRLLPACKKPVRPEVLRAIRSILPEAHIQLRFGHRIAGLGSLGRERFTGLGSWEGGNIAREAKAAALSACHFAARRNSGEMYLEEILRRAVRAHDPFWKLKDGWLVRRLSPDCFRLELAHFPKERDELHLFYSMGWETGNIHLGSGQSGQIRQDLRKKPRQWLYKAALAMKEQVVADWEAWRK